jgi:hypothetical protein
MRGDSLEKRKGLEERDLLEEWGKNALHIRILFFVGPPPSTNSRFIGCETALFRDA